MRKLTIEVNSQLHHFTYKEYNDFECNCCEENDVYYNVDVLLSQSITTKYEVEDDTLRKPRNIEHQGIHKVQLQCSGCNTSEDVTNIIGVEFQDEYYPKLIML